MPTKVWIEISNPLPNFINCTAEVWKWICDIIPYFIIDVIYKSMLWLKLIHVCKRGSRPAQQEWLDLLTMYQEIHYICCTLKEAKFWGCRSAKYHWKSCLKYPKCGCFAQLPLLGSACRRQHWKRRIFVMPTWASWQLLRFSKEATENIGDIRTAWTRQQSSYRSLTNNTANCRYSTVRYSKRLQRALLC